MNEENEKDEITPDDHEEVVDESVVDDPDSEEGDGDDAPDPSAAFEGKDGGDEDVDVGSWKRRAEDAERRAEEASRRFQETSSLLTNHLSNADQRKAQEAERERVSNMAPDERADYIARQSENRINFIAQQAEFKIQDANDRADFMSKAAKNPVYGKYADEVEKRIGEARKQGLNFTRDVMLRYVAGEKIVAAAEKGGSKKQKRTAAENVSKSKSSATKGMGDKKVNGGGNKSEYAATLERLRTTAI